MSVVKVQIRSGAYYDSVILMQLQSSLGELAGVLDNGVVMGTESNKDILAQTGLLVDEAKAAKPDDLVIVIKAEDEAAADAALGEVDGLLTRKRSGEESEYVPKSLEMGAEMLPDSQWVLISVPGRYAAGVARESLRLGKHVFLFSDNVSVEDEVALKKRANELGLFVMGPDCGTAIVNGVGLGFANVVRRGPIGMVAASGTGLQQVSCRIHQLGSGMTHALGTGGRDLKDDVGGITARQGVDFFARDPDTKVIVLVSKPPSPQVAEDLLKVARRSGKPVVVDFIGYAAPAPKVGNLHFVRTFDEAAAKAVELAKIGAEAETEVDISKFVDGQRYLCGLFSGGTLAFEALLILQDYLPAVYSNAPIKKGHNVLKNSLVSQENTIVDLGEDEFTVGRLHPMMDNTLRIQRLHQEAEDPAVAVILLDVVLGYGSHPNPAGELAPAIKKALATAKDAGRHLEVVAVVVGTDEDPQDFDGQIQLLKEAGAWVETRNDVAVRYVGEIVQRLTQTGEPAEAAAEGTPVALESLKQPLGAINAGLESFAESIKDQGAKSIHVDWKPPAGGNEKLAALLERMKQK
jgi:FdrA protein